MKAPVSLFLFFAVSFCFQPAMAEQLPLTISINSLNIVRSNFDASHHVIILLARKIEILAKAQKYDIRDMSHTVRHEMNYGLSLKQSIFTELEGIEGWALDNNIVQRKTPKNYFEMVDCSFLEEIDPKRMAIIR